MPYPSLTGLRFHADWASVPWVIDHVVGTSMTAISMLAGITGQLPGLAGLNGPVPPLAVHHTVRLTVDWSVGLSKFGFGGGPGGAQV